MNWESFFVAEVGAAAALAGLFFVALSINLKEIVASQGLASLSLMSVIVLGAALTISSLMLVPEQPALLLGSEVLLVGLLDWIVMSVNLWRSYRMLSRTRSWSTLLLSFLLGQASTLPFLIAGALLLLRGPVGVYLTVPGILFSFIWALTNGWVMLVELKR
ncbi:hypothetical protein EPA93_30720 [Ktedonosporobacter rubrisoli]|uniref:Uncharacterized protein n=1 Tax=Ktedonosporobacter rubrisoli TaxID=2509675 RepID=A0A4P6JWN3_KTERU|nr:hypothetical protein [Ktedonosporobacter rubrisoli]QBD80118.1 hypothetical protein EPA93_30720 [Ktedonosporobacter rubrisoli]